MKKQDFIHELDKALTQIDPQTRGEIISDINDHFTEGATQGLSEEEICKNLGQPGQIAEGVLEEYNAYKAHSGAGNSGDRGNGSTWDYGFAGIGESISSALESAGIGETISNTLKSARIGETISNALESADIGGTISAALESAGINGNRREYAQSGQHLDIDETFAGITAIKADLNMANLKILHEPQSRDIRVTIQGTSRFNDIGVENKYGTLVIRQKGPFIRFQLFNFKPSLEVVIYVPTGFDGEIKADVTMGSIYASGIRSLLKLETAAGSIKLDEYSGDHAKLNSGAGDISISGQTVGYVRAGTGTGKIRVYCLEAGEMRLDSGAGSIEVKAVKLGDIKLDSGAGSIRLESHDVQGNISASTGAGTIRMYLPQYTNHRIKAERPGIGSLKNQLTGNPDSPYTLKASSGAGSITLAAIGSQADPRPDPAPRPYQ